MAENMKRVSDPADPRRCQHVIPTKGQCINESVEGQHYCMAHGGAAHAAMKDKAIIRNYRIAQYQARVDEKSGGSEIKSLRDEIAILRILVEERVNVCKDSHDLLMQSGPISDLIMKVDKVVNSCHRLETHLGVMLDKTQALQWASEIVEIIGRHVEDEEAVSEISNELFASLARLSQPKAR